MQSQLQAWMLSLSPCLEQLVRVAGAMNDNSVVCFVDKVRRTRDVIQGGRLATPVTQLARMCHKPNCHIIQLCKALDLCKDLGYVLRLC